MAVMHGARGASLGLANAASRAQSQRDSERKIDPTASLRAFRTSTRVAFNPSAAASARRASMTSRRFSLNAKYDRLVGNVHGMRTGLGRKPQQQRPVEGGMRGDEELLAQLGLGLADAEEEEGERIEEGDGTMSYADTKRKYSLSGHALESKKKEDELAPEWLHNILYPPSKPPTPPVIPRTMMDQSGSVGLICSLPASRIPNLSYSGTMHGSLASSLQQMQLGLVNHGQAFLPPSHGHWQVAGLNADAKAQMTGHSSSIARLPDPSVSHRAQPPVATQPHGLQLPPHTLWQLAGGNHPFQLAGNSASLPPIPGAPILGVASPPAIPDQLRGILDQMSHPEPRGDRQPSKVPGIAAHRVRFLPVQQMYSPPLLTSASSGTSGASGASHTFPDPDQNTDKHAYVLQAAGAPTGPRVLAEPDGGEKHMPRPQAFASASSLPSLTPQDELRLHDPRFKQQQRQHDPPVQIQPALKRPFSHTDLASDPFAIADPFIPNALIQVHAEIMAEAPNHAKKRPRLTKTISGRSVVQTLEAQVEVFPDGYESDPLNLRPGEKWEDGTDEADEADEADDTDETGEGVDENDPFKVRSGRPSQARAINTADSSAAVTPRGSVEKPRTIKSAQNSSTESLRTQPLHDSLQRDAIQQDGKPSTSMLASPSSRNLRYRLLRNGRMVVHLPGKTPSCSSSSPTPHSTDESPTASVSPSTSPSPAPPHKVRVTEAISGIRLIPMVPQRNRHKPRAKADGDRKHQTAWEAARVHGFVDEETEAGEGGSNPSEEYTTGDSGNEGEDAGEEIEDWSSSGMSEAEVQAHDSRCSLSTVMEEEEEEVDGIGANAGRVLFQLPRGWEEAMVVGPGSSGEDGANDANLNGNLTRRRQGSASYFERRSAFGDGFFDRQGGGKVGFAIWRDGH